MTLDLNSTGSKEQVFEKVARYLTDQGLNISSEDLQRPWGGFFHIDLKDLEKFIDLFFPELNKGELLNSGQLNPKILIVAPNQRLSWQYHHKRAEIWKILAGPVGIIQSKTDEYSKDPVVHQTDSLIKLECEERHRMVGLNNWGVWAELWQHVDPNNPSSEEDIIRVEDDYARS